MFRTVATSLLLLAIAAKHLSSKTPEELSPADSLSFLFIGVVYGLTLVYGLLLRRRDVGPAAAYAQVLGDVLLASCLVYLTGGVDSPFTFTYSIAVLAAAILLFQRGALITAAATSVAFAVLVLSIRAGVLEGPQGSASMPAGRLLFVLTSNALAQFLLAVLAGYLARQLWATGGRLVAREADLKALVGLQNQIVNAIPSGLITCEADGTITFVNPAGRTMLGLEREANSSANIEQLIPGVLRLGPSARRAELDVETTGGSRTLGLAVTPLAEKGSLLVVFQDLTELRRKEDELRRADHLASLGKFSAQLAHEIRSPLASMRGSAQMLAGDVPSDSASARLAGILIRESDRLAGLVEDFLRFARPPPPVLEPLSLGALVSETVEMVRADPLARGVDLSAKLEEVVARGDSAQLRQVLLNLLRNALAAAGPGGKVEVSVARREERVQLRVWDSAGAIPPGDLGRVFEPFYSTREGGTGLGLSTAHSIVVAHGGNIEVASSPVTGTEFVVGLPSASEG